MSRKRQKKQATSENAVLELLRQKMRTSTSIEMVDSLSKDDNYFIEKSKEQPIQIVVAKNGIFTLVRNKMGVFVFDHSLSSYPIPFLKNILFQPIYWELPKIPWSLIQEQEEYFRDIYMMYKTEAYAQIWYNIQTKEYFNYVPEIEVASGGFIRWKLDHQNFDDPEKFILVADNHSHGNMAVYFSNTDDEDHQGVRLYCMINKIISDPTWNIRTSYGDIKVPIEENWWGEVFDMDQRLMPRYNPEWISRITQTLSAAGIKEGQKLRNQSIDVIDEDYEYFDD